jgi:hypothetical protein
MGNKIKRCGIYVRCSTGEQSTDSQITSLKEFAGARGWEIHKVYALPPAAATFHKAERLEVPANGANLLEPNVWRDRLGYESHMTVETVGRAFH